MTLLTGLFLSAWQITSAEEYGKHDEMFGSIYSKFLTILICIVGLIIPFTKIISSLMFSNDFYMAWEYVPVLLFAYIFHDLSAYLGSISTASKKTKTLFVSTLIGAILNIVLNLLLIPYLGAFGAAIATLLSYALVWIFRVFDSKKRVAIHYSFLIHAGDFAILTLQIICVFIGGVFFFILSFVLYLLLIVINAKSLRSLFVGARNVLKKRNMY